MSKSAESSNSLTAEEANQYLVDLLHQLEGRVAQALRLQHTPDDPYARDSSMAMAVDIAYTLVSEWRQFLTTLTHCPQNQALERYGPIATVVPPRLLAMALAVYASQGGTPRIVNLPDWTREWSYDRRYRGHPLYRKTLHYREGSVTDNAAAAPAPALAATAAPPLAAPAGPTLAAPRAPAPAVAAPPADPIPAHPAPAPTEPTAAKVKPKPAVPKAKASQAAVTFDAAGPSTMRTPPKAGPSRKRTFSGSSSNKESGAATPKRRKFIASPKAQIATRTGRRTRAPKVPPAKSKQAAKSKEILTDTDDERLDKLDQEDETQGIM